MDLIKTVVGCTVDQKYAVDRLLGRGGMGAVYAATHIGTGRTVALKIIAPRFMTDAESVERFRREAQAAGRLRHPNVVNVTDFGIWKGELGPVPYLVMEYLDGLSLRELLRREGVLPLHSVIEIIEQVCVAVQKAHDSGIVHRDLKPDNIWLEPNDLGGYTVKVLDFGLARLSPTGHTKDASHSLVPGAAVSSQATTVVSPFSERTDTNVAAAEETIVQPEVKEPEDATLIQMGDSATPELTRAGSVLGTPYYMSPEQCRGEAPGPASDIYSLGVIIYEMLSGGRPFEGSTPEVVRKHVEQVVPDLGIAMRKVPRAVREVVSKTLAKKPDDRPSSAAALAAMLRARSEGFGAVLQRALTICTRHSRSILLISFVVTMPLIVLDLLEFFVSSGLVDQLLIFLTLLMIPITFSIMVGLITPFVAQVLLRPYGGVTPGDALAVLKKFGFGFVWASTRFFARVLLLLVIVMVAVLVLTGTAGKGDERSRSGVVAENHDDADAASDRTGSETQERSVAYELGLRAGRLAKDHPTMGIVAIALPLLIVIVPVVYVTATTPRRVAQGLLYGPALIMERLNARDSLRRSRELYRVIRTPILFLIVTTMGWWMLAALADYVFVTHVAGAGDWGRGVFAIGLVLNLFSAVVTVLVTPVLVIAIALLYFQARAFGGETLQVILAEWSGSGDAAARGTMTLDRGRFGSGSGV